MLKLSSDSENKYHKAINPAVILIPEKSLFFVAMIGGSAGSAAGMKYFRHKTKHTKFKVGIPLILAFQLMMAVLCIVQMIKR